MKDKLLKIINHYGVIPQLKYFQSEVFELNEAVLANYYDCEGCEEGCVKHITEEIADVLVMLNQFMLYYNITGDDVIKIMEQKIDRQLKRMEDEKNE